MFNPKKEDFDGENNYHENQTADDVHEESSIDVGGFSREIENSGNGSNVNLTVSEGSRSRSVSGFTERLRNVFSDEGEDDLLLQQCDRENNVFQWLQALDLQVIGACRADERLKPLLKLNVSSGVAEDHLLAHLSQHFEVPEVGMLARCLCVPLVSIRVGKVIKQGTLLCPTGTRGNLNLTLLPSSGLRFLFVGDDGHIERLATLRCNSESSVVIEEISADKSGRSFLVKLPEGEVSYFWCSEKTKFLGFELLAKMKDLLRSKPSLAQLTGISESRLDGFATYLRAYLGSSVRNNHVNPNFSSIPSECDSRIQVPSSSIKPPRSRCNSGQAGKPNALYQGILSPRSNSFKDGAPRNLSSIRSVQTREKFRRRGDSHCSFSVVDVLPVSSALATEASSIDQTANRKISESELCSFVPVNILDSIGSSTFSPSSNFLAPRVPSPQISTTSSLLSPYYCWCPPCTSTLQYTVTPPHLLISTTESLLIPPRSKLFSAAMTSSSLTPPKLPFDLDHVPSLDFPAFLPDPVDRVPLPVSSFITVSSSQHIPTFTPLMCDPIVHIPVMDVCSSGQGYLVSAGPAISTTIPPLHSNFVNPLIPETESMVEKGARETLRLLLSSTQTNPQLIEVFPSVLTSMENKHSMVVGSRALYSGNSNVEAIAKSIVTIGLVSLPHSEGGVTKSCCLDHNLENQFEGSRDLEGSCCIDDDTKDPTIVNDTRERLDAA